MPLELRKGISNIEQGIANVEGYRVSFVAKNIHVLEKSEGSEYVR